MDTNDDTMVRIATALERIAAALEKKREWKGSWKGKTEKPALPPPKPIEEYTDVPDYLIAIGFSPKSFPDGTPYYQRWDDQTSVSVIEREPSWWSMSFYKKDADPQKWHYKPGMNEMGEIYDTIHQNILRILGAD